jgi:hypothetical protein
MALFTPRGLKLRLPTAYAFTLIARVYPRTDAFRVLQLTEAVENLSGLASFIAAFAAFALPLEPIQIGLAVFVTVAVFRLMHLCGFFVPPFTLLLPLSRVYSFASGYGVLFAGLLIFGFLTSGWQGVVAFVLARVLCGVVFGVIDLAYGKNVFRTTGVAVTASERSFFHAYRLEASRLGASTDLGVSDAEVASERWKVVYEDLAIKWPLVVNRFTGDDA